MNRALNLALALLFAIALLGVGYYSGQHYSGAVQLGTQHTHQPETASHLPSTAKKIWACPMHPHIMQDHPGSCPICGMDLVETEGAHEHEEQLSASADVSPTAGAMVTIDAATQQRMGVRLASLTTQSISREVQTYGNVTINEASLLNISPKIDGWIRKLNVTVGQQVQTGQVLYEIYSPELVQRQREYIELLQRRDQLLDNVPELIGQNAQIAASLARERIRSREKFGYADVDDKTLELLEKNRRTIDVIAVRATRPGFVTQIGVREGNYVTPMINVLSIADVSKLWIDIALYPDQLEWIREGDQVTARLPHSSQPGITGRLKFASPVVDSTARTVKARVVVNNPHSWLRPGAFVDVTIATRTHKALALPRSAIMRTGRGSQVMLARGDGHFVPAPVETGIESGDFVEITDGLQAGAQVAVNGQFLLDAASSLNDAVQRMQEH